MTISISKQNIDIIAKLKAGMSPGQIAIAYENEGKSVSVSHCRHVKMLLETNMTDMLKELPENFTSSSPREYEKRMTEAYKTTLAKHGLSDGDYTSVCLSSDRTYYTVTLNDNSLIDIDSGFAYFID